MDVEQLGCELDECKRVEKDLSSWIKCIKECITINSLTRAIVVELIDRIDVSEVYSVNGEKNLDISICYKFGRFNLTREPRKEKELARRYPPKDNPSTSPMHHQHPYGSLSGVTEKEGFEPSRRY